MRNRIAIFLAGVAISITAHAQPYPGRPVTILNPYPAGGQNDVMSRVLAESLQAKFKQPFVVLSKEGASGVVGMTSLTTSLPDGLTLAFTVMTPLTIQPHLVPSLKLSPNAVAPVCGLTENVFAIAVRNESPLQTIEDLVATAKRGPSLTYGSGGINSGPSLGAEELARQNKVEFIQVPYRGDKGSMIELLAGRIDFAAIISASATQFVNDGRLRLLAVMSNERDPSFPNVPTMVERNMPVTEVAYAGLFAPKGTPAYILNVLEQACREASTSDSIKQVTTGINTKVKFQDRAQFASLLREQYQLQSKRLKAAK